MELELKTIPDVDWKRGMRLSSLAGWNQTPADWKFLLTQGRGIGFYTPNHSLVASAVSIPMGGDGGWISMVLTDPAWRRRGLASRLMEDAIRDLESAGRTAFLDATPAGEKVYRSLGFSGCVRLTRWVLTRPVPHAQFGADPLPGTRIEPITPSDIKAFATWEADRMPGRSLRPACLAYLLQQAPSLTCALRPPGGFTTGFLLGRPGVRYTQLGPIMAENPADAIRLVCHALARSDLPVVIDSFDHQEEFSGALKELGASPERGFLRMGRNAQPNSPATVHHSVEFAAAGPELG